MDTKKDIYNLWIQYTTKNEENFFRQFVLGFVQVWKNQLDLDLSKVSQSHAVIADGGPHLSRLPEELLPAITKFIIIARDELEKGELSNQKLGEISILTECLIIICRNFENIPIIVKYEYIGNLVAIISKLYSKILITKEITQSQIVVFENVCKFLEFIYDPCLTWRNFLNGYITNYSSLSYISNSVHVEIIPFIYDCFQNKDIFRFPVFGIGLIHVLASIISGSQKSLALESNFNKLSGERTFSVVCDKVNNGLRAICPATVSIIMNVISKWECPKELRKITLKCFALMVMVLQRSSPEERQIELVTILQLYSNTISELLKINHFQKNVNYNISQFEISTDESIENLIDINALQETIKNIKVFFVSYENQDFINCAILETNLVEVLIEILTKIKDWNIDHESISCHIIKTLTVFTKLSTKIIEHMKDLQSFIKLFDAIQNLGTPKDKILQLCFYLAFNDDKKRFIIPELVVNLVKWLADMKENEQNYLSNLVLLNCCYNYKCKLQSCEGNIIFAACECLCFFQNLSKICIQNLLKLIEELASVSIKPREMKSILFLLRKETQFPYSEKLLQSLVRITLQDTTAANFCTQYLDIQTSEDGITVPDIKKWIISGSYGFVFHSLLRFDQGLDYCDHSNKNYRRMIFKILTSSNVGYEIFVQHNENLVVAALTKREYLATSISTKNLLDGCWHYITVVITPPKRPFSYSQINIYIDFVQKLSSTLKVQSINEPFNICTIGSTFSCQTKRKMLEEKLTCSASHDNTNARGIFPNFLEKTLSSNVSNYFTLPLRNSVFDPNVKSFPIGMENNVFGEPISLNGQINSVVLADQTLNLKTLFDYREKFSSIFSQDIESIDIASRFVFCYSAASYFNNLCPDLVPCGKFPAEVIGQHYHLFKIQNTIHSVGGMQCIIPILDNLIKVKNNFIIASDINNDDIDVDVSKKIEEKEFLDWKIISSTSYTEWKMLQNPIAIFFCFLRYLIHNNEKNQVNLFNSKCLDVIGILLLKCDFKSFDVHSLMSIHLFIESIQNQNGSISTELLNSLHGEIAFNFAIWSRMEFQITLGHIQYLGTMIKNDRKYFRKKFGIQFILDIVRYYYAVPENITEDDAKTIRSNLFNIIRYFLQKDVNIKEIGCIISFIASIKQDQLLKEVLEMLLCHLKGKNCIDQMILLLYEPNTANLFYNIFINKVYSDDIHCAVIRIIDSLLSTSRVEQKYKQILRLQDVSGFDIHSLYPGFFSYIPEFCFSSTILFTLIDQILLFEPDYCALVFLIHHTSLYGISPKLEVAKKLMQTTYLKKDAPIKIAEQIGWQESIARLLISKPISVSLEQNNTSKSGLGIDLNDVLLEDIHDYTEIDLISFCESKLTKPNVNTRENNLIFNEIQASVTEAANVLENEIKEIAESVSDVVTENVSNVFSVLRQRTSQFQESLESFSASISTSTEAEMLSGLSVPTRTSSNSSEDQLSSQSSFFLPKKKTQNEGSSNLPTENDIDDENQLVHLVTNVLFTVLWRGIRNDNANCWKERGQVLACINLLGLNNELIASHLTLKLKILELGVQASLVELSVQGHQTLAIQENAYQLLRMVYDLVALGSNEDESKKCSTKLLDAVVSLIDCLMIFQQGVSDDWSDMIRLSLGLLLKCSIHPNMEIVAIATSKLLSILQNRNLIDSREMAFLLYNVNQALNQALEVDNTEQYAFLIPIIKILLEKCKEIFNLNINLSDLPHTKSGPTFFRNFQTYSTTKKWKIFIEKKVS